MDNNFKKHSSTLISKEEDKIKDRIASAIELLITELEQTMISSDSTLEIQEAKLDKLQDEIIYKINKAMRKSIFNFTKLLFSKDLRRNVSYFQIFLHIKEISKTTLQTNKLVLNLKYEYNFFENEYRKKTIAISIESLVSYLETLISILDSEDVKEVKQFLKESKEWGKVFEEKAIFGFDWNSTKLENLDVKTKKEIMYKYFSIVKNLDIILNKVREISKLIIYIETGKL